MSHWFYIYDLIQCLSSFLAYFTLVGCLKLASVMGLIVLPKFLSWNSSPNMAVFGEGLMRFKCSHKDGLNLILLVSLQEERHGACMYREKASWAHTGKMPSVSQGFEGPLEKSSETCWHLGLPGFPASRSPVRKYISVMEATSVVFCSGSPGRMIWFLSPLDMILVVIWWLLCYLVNGVSS